MIFELETKLAGQDHMSIFVRAKLAQSKTKAYNIAVS